jgi:O-antigen/teichoic acid export membrane protein
MKIGSLLKHKFLRDSTTLQVGAMVSALGNLISLIALTRLLGARLQGEFYVAQSLYGLLWFVVNLGLYQVTISQVAAATARGLHEKALGWLAFLIKAYAAIGIGVGVIGFALLPVIAERVLHTEVHVGMLAAYLALLPLIELPRVVASAALQGTRRMMPLTLIENGQEAARVFLVVAGAMITGDATGPVIGTIAASAIGSVVAIALYRKESEREGTPLPKLRDVLASVKVVPLTAGLRLGVRIGAMRNIGVLGTQIFPTLLLERFGSTEWVAYMRIAQRIMNVALMMMTGVSRTVLPVFSEIAGLKDLGLLRRKYFQISFSSGALIATGFLVTFPFLPFLIECLFPTDYHDPVWRICLILVPGFLALSLSVANDTFYLVTNTLRVAIYMNLGGVIVCSTVMGFLAWLHPTVGAAWGLSLTMVCGICHMFYATWWFRRHASASGSG